ncbi:hypothetical protein LDENG_00243420, partial [Lucifuga dentata]
GGTTGNSWDGLSLTLLVIICVINSDALVDALISAANSGLISQFNIWKQSAGVRRMSVTISNNERVTVFTVTSDPNSNCPLLCQILKSLCYSPACCSVSQRLRRIQSNSQSVLGSLHIMVGLINIGLGATLCSGGGSGWQMYGTLFPYWFGALFLIFGIMCILSEKFPSQILVIINVMLNLAGVPIAMASIALYSVNLADMSLYWLCRRDDDRDWYYRTQTPKPSLSPEAAYIMEQCMDGKALILMLLRSINIVLLVMSTLELCLVISSSVLGIKALVKNKKDINKNPDDTENYKPLLAEVTENPIA